MNAVTVENFKHEDTWQDVKDATMNTIGKATGSYPDSAWKLKLIRAEHSPIRKMKFSWRWVNLPYWVSVHFVRHKIGIEHFVRSQRSDRTGEDRTAKTQDAPVSHECECNGQSLISISRKRLCNCASPETRAAWQLVKDEVAKCEPELAHCMVRECVYRGFCPEMFGCGYDKTDAFRKELEAYRGDCSSCSTVSQSSDKARKNSSTNEFDEVEKPKHYTDGKIDPIDFIEDKNLGFCLGNVVKYVARAGKKQSADKSNKEKTIQDLKKARWYINRRIKELKENICE